MGKAALLVALGVTAVAVAAPVSPAHSRTWAKGSVTVRLTGKLTAHEVTNGGVSARGRFTASGAISDKGTFVDRRTRKGTLITVRRAVAGVKGTIVFVIRINTATASDHWTIGSATRKYKGLHGGGTETSDVYSTPARFTMTGTVSR